MTFQRSSEKGLGMRLVLPARIFMARAIWFVASKGGLASKGKAEQPYKLNAIACTATAFTSLQDAQQVQDANIPERAHLIQKAAERPHVGLLVVGLLVNLLGRHIERRAHVRVRE
jgi:hypothetical protein